MCFETGVSLEQAHGRAAVWEIRRCCWDVQEGDSSSDGNRTQAKETLMKMSVGGSAERILLISPRWHAALVVMKVRRPTNTSRHVSAALWPHGATVPISGTSTQRLAATVCP